MDDFRRDVFRSVVTKKKHMIVVVVVDMVCGFCDISRGSLSRDGLESFGISCHLSLEIKSKTVFVRDYYSRHGFLVEQIQTCVFIA